MRIIVAEYPKSGGSWLVSMLAHALSIPPRDIYIDDGYKLFDLTNHPWYKGAKSCGLTESCVIKSHELPDSPLHNFPAHYIHLIRDGRDVIVSKFFFEKEFCVKNGILPGFDMTFDDFVEKTSLEWSHYVSEWLKKPAIVCNYEDLLGDPFSVLGGLCSSLGIQVSRKILEDSVKAYTRDNFRKALNNTFKSNTFVRKGIAGDWKNHFSERHKEMVKKCAGTKLIMAGYEENNDW
ncbi:MAG: sulfotransferase domain-containing protein [Thermodesulfovibrionales bacterium]